jgi:hypothetical protein
MSDFRLVNFVSRFPVTTPWRRRLENKCQNRGCLFSKQETVILSAIARRVASDKRLIITVCLKQYMAGVPQIYLKKQDLKLFRLSVIKPSRKKKD